MAAYSTVAPVCVGQLAEDILECLEGQVRTCLAKAFPGCLVSALPASVPLSVNTTVSDGPSVLLPEPASLKLHQLQL